LDYALSLDKASEVCDKQITQTHVEVCFEYANFFDERMLLLIQSVHLEKIMTTGKVKWFNSQKGFGFIEVEGGAPDVFVHITAVQNAGMTGLQEGQSLTFDLEAQQNGKQAAVNLQNA
jgi:CspA family cold shock protein